MPKDFNPEQPNENLLSKMILAVKLEEEALEVFLEKDKDTAAKQWAKLLTELSDHIEVVLVTLGAMATNTVLSRKERLSKFMGKSFKSRFSGKDSLFLKAFRSFIPIFFKLIPT